MTKKEAYDKGYDRGYAIGIDNNSLISDVDKYLSECDEIEDNSRCYSEFSFTVCDINRSPYSDEVWDNFDDGTADGFWDAWKKRPFADLSPLERTEAELNTCQLKLKNIEGMLKKLQGDIKYTAILYSGGDMIIRKVINVSAAIADIIGCL